MPHRVRYAGTARIEAQRESLSLFPGRGRKRGRSGSIHSIPFRRSATILHRITRREVLIPRVLRSGRDVERDIARLG